MNIFKIFAFTTKVSGEIQSMMSDNFVSIEEIINLIDESMKEFLGKGLSEIGLKVSKDEQGKTRVEFLI